MRRSNEVYLFSHQTDHLFEKYLLLPWDRAGRKVVKCRNTQKFMAFMPATLDSLG